MEDRITIAVAHRLSTIRDADIICVFCEGRIVEGGMYDEFVKQISMVQADVRRSEPRQEHHGLGPYCGLQCVISEDGSGFNVYLSCII